MLERFEEEPESLLRLLVGDLQQLEHPPLELGVVDSDAPTADLAAVEYQVVRLRLNGARLLLQPRHILLAR